ncbi:methyltransferase [Anaeramoeba ignava]|uniref:Methyltransferase n=1 Tax=Anaeramoeba ignava TaxID=1746090 RepID=A0A9Q0LJP5_ANAIG|nr:methyltransferase [Anaeramoeba ignava]
MDDFGSPSFWEDKYKKSNYIYEWYMDLNFFFPKIENFVSSESVILNVGCGNSSLCQQLLDKGVKKITNIDVSQEILDKLQSSINEKDSVQFIKMNAKKMQFEDDTFDLIFDKGLIDSILCSKNFKKKVYKYLKEIKRVLKPNGYFFILSHSSPEQRLIYLTDSRLRWEVTTVSIPQKKFNGITRNYFLYILDPGDN